MTERRGALAGKAVLVTGASSGIGRAIALACAQAGADVGITYRRNAEGGDAVVAELEAAGARAAAWRFDLADPAGPAALAAQVRAALGRCDAWINNAGADILTGEGAALTREAKLARVLEIDVEGTVRASWAAAALLGAQPAGGVILNMAWDHTRHGMAGENPGIYAAAKGAVEAFSKSLARDVAPRVRVNVLSPGFIETAFGEQASPAWRRHVETVTPLGRWGRPEDVAAAAVYLCSDAAAFITGQTVMINGGVVM